jgi:NAD-dependent DNA ligase
MVGLLIIFSLATAATFGLFIFHHAEKAALDEQHSRLSHQAKELRGYEGYVAGLIPPLDTLIVTRRALSKALAEADTQAMNDVDRLIAKDQQGVKAIQEAIAKQIKTYQDVLKDAKERRMELATEETRAFSNEREFDKRRADQRSKIEVISQEIEAVKKKGRAENAGYNTRIALLEERVLELTQQREMGAKELKPDGQLLQASANDGFVVINIGQRQSLRKGTRFTVFNRRAGKIVVKGVIEVTRIEERIATARVLSESDHNDPLLANDYITNPIYNPEKIVGFAVRGDFTHYSKDELKRFIIENGGRYDEELSVNTDYVVAGERCDAALEEALRIGISILSEEQLIESQLFRLSNGQKQ